MKRIDLVGQRFGRLLVVSEALKLGNNRRVVCVCDCGNKRNVSFGNLRSGMTASCGCLRSELLAMMTTRHGMTRTPEYRAWAAMRNRCRNTSKMYAHWNGRGIKVCSRWDVFENFLADVGPRPGRGYSIDRINVDGDYDPSNVRWATRKQQANNTTKTFRIKFNGVDEAVCDVAQRVGLKPSTLYTRVTKYGFSVEDAIKSPLLKNQYDPRSPKQKYVRPIR